MNEIQLLWILSSISSILFSIGGIVFSGYVQTFRFPLQVTSGITLNGRIFSGCRSRPRFLCKEVLLIKEKMTKEFQNTISGSMQNEIHANVLQNDTGGHATRIIVEKTVDLTSEHPFCSLPSNYFERLRDTDSFSERTLLSVKSWDGRDILSVTSD